MTIGPDFDGVLTAARAGEDWAFSLLYRDVNPSLLRYLGAQAPGAAEDLASDTWLAVAGHLGSFVGGERAFRGWFFTIARHRLVQHWRDNGRRPVVVAAPESFVERAGSEDTEAAVLALVSAQEAAAVIASALTPDQAEIVLLRILAGLDVEQVAEILNKRPGTIRVLQHRALRRLAQTFSIESLTR